MVIYSELPIIPRPRVLQRSVTRFNRPCEMQLGHWPLPLGCPNHWLQLSALAGSTRTLWMTESTQGGATVSGTTSTGADPEQASEGPKLCWGLAVCWEPWLPISLNKISSAFTTASDRWTGVAGTSCITERMGNWLTFWLGGCTDVFALSPSLSSPGPARILPPLGANWAPPPRSWSWSWSSSGCRQGAWPREGGSVTWTCPRVWACPRVCWGRGWPGRGGRPWGSLRAPAPSTPPPPPGTHPSPGGAHHGPGNPTRCSPCPAGRCLLGAVVDVVGDPSFSSGSPVS